MKYIITSWIAVMLIWLGHLLPQDSIRVIETNEIIKEVPVDRIVIQEKVVEVPNTERIYINGDCSEEIRERTSFLEEKNKQLIDRIAEINEPNEEPIKYEINRELMMKLEINPLLNCRDFGFNEKEERICKLFRETDKDSWVFTN